MTDFRIRSAEAVDLPVLIDMLRDDPIGRTREDGSDAARLFYTHAFEEIAADPNSALLVAEADGRVVGCVQVTTMPGLSYRGARRAILEDLRVASDLRGQRIGARLLAAAEAHAVERGCQLIEFFVHSDRKDAQRFYEREGYTGRHRGFRKPLNGN